MLRQIAFEFNPILKEKELEWDLHIPEGIEITCDPDKLERAVDNLIRNAVNYSYRQSCISFSLEKAGERVKICMENRGQTIPQEKLERIFEQFYRLDGARSSDSGGAGLGLAIAREIVRAHGGTIAAYSADEKIRFEIGSLPASCGNRTASGVKSLSGEPGSVSVIHCKKIVRFVSEKYHNFTRENKNTGLPVLI